MTSTNPEHEITPRAPKIGPQSAQSEPTPRVKEPLGRTAFDFYRCAGGTGCGAWFTRLEELERLSRGEFCPCGSLRYSPTNYREEWGEDPRVLRYIEVRGKVNGPEDVTPTLAKECGVWKGV